jgi:signal transduction histidine kinase
MSQTADAPDPADIDVLNEFAQSAMRSWQPGTVKAIGGAMSLAGRPHLVALSPIAVNSETRVALGEKPENTLVFVRALDDAHLAVIAADFGLAGLEAARGGNGTLPLVDPLGRPAALSLTWTKSQVGSQFVADALRPIALVGATVILLFIVLGFVWTLIVGRIRQAAIAAEDVNRSKGLFIANMTHELRTPLNAIIGFSELMSKEAFGPITIPKYKEYAIDIATSGSHLLGIVNNILLFSKMEARRNDIDIESLDLEHAVAGIVRVMQIEAERRRIRLIAAPFPAPVSIEADPQALKQILFNVIGNAIKFSSPNSEVVLKPAGITPNGTYELQVIDHGCGIPKKTQSQLGSAFVQADNTFTRKHQGTGLGLAISIGLAESMGAAIEIESTENVGTTVSVRLRVTAQNAEEPLGAQEASQAA